ncbi:lysosomal thioesterase PPT2-like [Petromyzon marinus]|uniref:lysosomal thioesterase PPT2-like n=1 Tax=Petromyzon marinus TaxID=7757 RepID=UPI003F712C00
MERTSGARVVVVAALLLLLPFVPWLAAVAREGGGANEGGGEGMMSRMKSLVMSSGGSGGSSGGTSGSSGGTSSSGGSSVSSGVRRPVVIVHGLRDGPGNYQTLARRVREALPGTPVVVLGAFSDDVSIMALWRQLRSFWREMERVNSSHGLTIICVSQGAMVCRAILSMVHHHRVHTFISLGGPLMGVYGGEPLWVQSAFPWLLSVISALCYWRLGQEVSVCNYWHDPTQQQRYLQKNLFLPIINNETPHRMAHVFKRNFVQLRRLVLVGGSGDGELRPWQTSLFGFFDSNASTVIDMVNQPVYVQDLFGLRTLDRRGGLVTCSVPGVVHKAWVHSETAFVRCIQPHLT